VWGIRTESVLLKKEQKGRTLFDYAFGVHPSRVRKIKVDGTAIVRIIDRSSKIKEYVPISEKFSIVSSFTQAFLLGSYYSGQLGKVYLKFYDDENNKVYVWYDSTGHLPYFLTDLPPDKVSQIPKVVNDRSFERVEVVEKYDLLLGKGVRLTKIVVKDPRAVPRLRKVVPTAWEAKIKYHDNYIFDTGLVPGMLYSLKNGKLKEIGTQLSEETIELVRKAFKEEGKDVTDLALKLSPFFETRPPKMKRIAVDIEVYTPFRGRVPDKIKTPYPIISIALCGSDGLRKVLMLAREDVGFGSLKNLPNDVEVEIFDSERALIMEFIRIVNEYLLVLTFNGDDFDLPYVFNRATTLGIEPDYIPFEIVRDFIGVKHGFHIDLYKFFSIEAIQNYAFGSAYKEKTLDAIASALLGEAKVRLEVSISDLPMSELANYNFMDAYLTLTLTTFSDDLVWKLMVLIMRLAKMSLEDVTRRKVSAWIKNLMFWEHRRRNYLIPNESDLLRIKGKVVTAAKIGGKRYAGAIVIDPIPGVYFRVVVLDFASLYPSIIKVWNLSYETIDPPPDWCRESKITEIKDESGKTLHKVCMDKKGITSQLVGLLRDFRVRVYKKMSKDKRLPNELRNWYDVVQKAMKVYINASYGVFGHEKFPFYTPSLAESVTALGRYVITATLKKAKELGLRVIYGDTDSLFLWNPQDDKLQELIEWVEHNFGLDFELDKIYKYVAFALKKNYLGVHEDGKVEIKGMVGKKRNVPKILQDTFIDIVKTMATLGDDPDTLERMKEGLREKVKDLYFKLKNKDFTLDEVAFRTTLNKSINAYVKTTPIHVKAAKQLQKYGVLVGRGDIILYVKTRTRDKVKAIQLAKLDDIDINEYLEAAKSVFQQLLLPFSIQWEEIAGNMGLFFFSTSRK
jgi:DNA polymerase I